MRLTDYTGFSYIRFHVRVKELFWREEREDGIEVIYIYKYVNIYIDIDIKFYRTYPSEGCITFPIKLCNLLSKVPFVKQFLRIFTTIILQ